MVLVRCVDDIINNTQTLDSYLTSSVHEEFTKNIIKRGICFIVLKSAIGTRFYPSRFVGYIGNTESNHNGNEEKDGRETTHQISLILGKHPTTSPEFDQEFFAFCRKIGVKFREMATLGIIRKYWDLCE